MIGIVPQGRSSEEQGDAGEMQGNETCRRGGDKLSKGKAGHREQGIEMAKLSLVKGRRAAEEHGNVTERLRAARRRGVLLGYCTESNAAMRKGTALIRVGIARL